MPLDFNNLFGIHEQALKLHAKRGETIASNLANADTPGYKARDIDFQAALQNAQAGSASGMKATQAGHIQGNTPDNPDLQYRTAVQPSVDGNTVDGQVEKQKYMESAMRYEASLSFIDGQLKQLLAAIKGQ